MSSLVTGLDNLTDDELNDRERRIRAAAVDARKALNAARARYESLTDALRDIRLIRAARLCARPSGDR